MSAPAQLLPLIERFKSNRDNYRKGKFNETQLRIDYLNPLFELLGWDIANRVGLPEDEREVIHEDQIKIDGATKAPDYCFRINGKRKFFLEAKKPSVNIKDDIAPAFQLRRYAWSAKLPLSILSDFEEIAIYDCRINPDRLDRASVARISYFTFDQLADMWEEFSSIFSREAVVNGSLDAFAKKSKTKRGTDHVDDAFLKEIEGWRESLAKDIAKRNTTLTQAELHDAVQRTIDRIIFLRICEDRGIEEYGRLQALKNGTNTYARLMQLFHQADARYNSGLFHFRHEKGESESPDQLTPDLHIGDAPLKEIFRRLYYPDSPYEFSVIPASILGQVYEQFLGKVILLDNKHNATVEEKPEVRKAGGVYYTPEYIAEYIVNNTVGNLVEGKTPKEVATLRVLDPACGSGSFLLVAYDFLLGWHRNWYQDHDPEGHAARKNPPIYRVLLPAVPGETEATTVWRLTTAEKKRILLANIYGVDIDRQAVEVTKLSLLLKMLEGESEQTLGKQMKLMHDRVLPDLGNNIKCGNSLISSDFYDDHANATLDLPERQRINAFDWEDEFPTIMKNGGFDAVIGNPPYGAELTTAERQYLDAKFQIGNNDTAALFMVMQLQELLTKNALGGFIVPKTFAYASNWKKTRAVVLPYIEKFIDVSKVWKEVKLEQVIYFAQKNKSNSYISGKRMGGHILELGDVDKEICKNFDFILNSISQAELSVALKMVSSNRFINDEFINQRGAMLQSKIINQKSDYKVIGGKQINRYGLETNSVKGWIDIEAVDDNKAFANGDSVIVQNIIAHIQNPVDHIQIIATISSEKDVVILDTVNQLKPIGHINNHLLLGIINSKLISWYVYRFIFAKAIRTMHFDSPVTKRIPLPKKLQSKNLEQRVREVLELKRNYQQAKTSQDKTFLTRQIEQTDKKIDRLVYELYGLTEEEIAIVEG